MWFKSSFSLSPHEYLYLQNVYKTQFHEIQYSRNNILAQSYIL